MTAKPEKPCPACVRVEGRWIYCEVGKDRHSGTHVGDKPEHQYRAELWAWRDSKTNNEESAA